MKWRKREIEPRDYREGIETAGITGETLILKSDGTLEKSRGNTQSVTSNKSEILLRNLNLFQRLNSIMMRHTLLKK